MLKNNTDLLYLLLGVGVGAMASLAKSIRNAKTFSVFGVVKMMAEALTCSLLTSGLALGLNEYYDVSFVYAIAIGAFIGSVGSSVMIEFAKTALTSVLPFLGVKK